MSQNEPLLLRKTKLPSLDSKSIFLRIWNRISGRCNFLHISEIIAKLWSIIHGIYINRRICICDSINWGLCPILTLFVVIFLNLWSSSTTEQVKYKNTVLVLNINMLSSIFTKISYTIELCFLKNKYRLYCRILTYISLCCMECWMFWLWKKKRELHS